MNPREPRKARSRAAVVLRNPVNLAAFGFGAGLVPVAPGTAGTLLAVAIYVSIPPVPLAWYLAGVALATGVGIWLCGSCARALRTHDHPGIVWDEIVGYFVTMTAAPPGWLWIVIGFLSFRIFDTLKPWPIGPIDGRVHGGLGIMLDDVMAGVYSCIVVQVIHWVWTIPGV